MLHSNPSNEKENGCDIDVQPASPLPSSAAPSPLPSSSSDCAGSYISMGSSCSGGGAWLEPAADELALLPGAVITGPAIAGPAIAGPAIAGPWYSGSSAW
eukprot:638714-Prymnesium_polylepis.2